MLNIQVSFLCPLSTFGFGGQCLNQSNLPLMTPIRLVPVRELCAQEPLPCEADSTSCQSANGSATCLCLAGFIHSTYSNTSCKGKTNSLPDCSAMNASFYEEGSRQTLVSLCSVPKWMEGSWFQLCAVSMLLSAACCACRC